MSTLRQRFVRIALFAGVFYAAFWGLSMWFLAWHDDGAIVDALVTSVIAGILFGLAMGGLEVWQARKKAEKDSSEPSTARRPNSRNRG